MRSLREIELALIKGDSVSTKELKSANGHYERLREDLGKLGQRWHFAFTEANRLWMLTGSYLRARER
jgi:hypothetical protein